MTPTDWRGPAEEAEGRTRHWLERAHAEMSFAAMLCEFHPRRAAAWTPLIERAARAVAAGAAAGGPRAAAAAVRRAEGALAPLTTTAKRYAVHCVGHAHIDMNWTWSWPETVAVTNDTFTTVLRLMDEYPDFRFSQSQASVYAIAEQYHPELLAAIARRVREGRWEVTASHWVENEKNLADGESLCRHLLYTRRYMGRLFGLAPEAIPIDWSPDTFGHPATVPTYLTRGGVRYLYLHRPGTEGPPRPSAFWWRGPDGSRLLVRNDMAVGYNGVITPATLLERLGAFVREAGLPEVMFVYGVGDHGGGPTRRDVLRALDMAAWPVFPQVLFSTARSFFEWLEREGARLPVLSGELNTEFTGCYTTQTLIKKANRYAEARLVDAEAASALCWAAGAGAYPAGAFEAAWRDTLFNQFHDILPGSGVHDTRTYAHGLCQKTLAMTSMAETTALRELARRVDTRFAGTPGPVSLPPSRVRTALGSGAGFGAADGGLSQADQTAGRGPRPFLVFNPLAFGRRAVVEATVWDDAYGGRARELQRAAFSVGLGRGRTVAAQTLDAGGYWGHDYVRVAFPVDVEGFGWTTAVVKEGRGPQTPPAVWHLGREHHCAYTFYERGPEGLENRLVRLEIDPGTGGIRALVHKASGVALIGPERPAPLLEYAVERPHPMSAWTVDHTGAVEFPRAEGIRRVRKGPWVAALEVRARIRASEFTVTYEVRADDPAVYLRLAGTWFERGTPETGVPVLRMAFPLALQRVRAAYEIPFGALERDPADGVEVPALRWARVAGRAGRKPAGCLLLNDSKHGHAMSGRTLRLTLIRSSYEPDVLPEIGRHEVQLALRPWAGACPDAEAIRLGQAFTHPLRVVSTDIHRGVLPARAWMARVTGRTAIVSALKKAETEDALILRLFEPSGTPGAAGFDVNPRLLGRLEDATPVDLMERPLARTRLRVREGRAVSVPLPAHGIASVRLRLQRR